MLQLTPAVADEPSSWLAAWRKSSTTQPARTTAQPASTTGSDSAAPKIDWDRFTNQRPAAIAPALTDEPSSWIAAWQSSSTTQPARTTGSAAPGIDWDRFTDQRPAARPAPPESAPPPATAPPPLPLHAGLETRQRLVRSTATPASDRATPVGAQLLMDNTPTATLVARKGAVRKWEQFRAERNEPMRLPIGLSPENTDEILALFLLWTYDNMRPGKHSAKAAQPKSAKQVVGHVRAQHLMDGITLPPSPRIAKLVAALEVKHAREHGPEALVTVRKEPMTIKILLTMRATVAGTTIDGRTVDWDAPFWVTIWAVLLTLFYFGGRKSDILPTAVTPFDKRRMSRQHMTFVARGTLDRPSRARTAPTANLLQPFAGATVLLRMGASKADQAGTVNADFVSRIEDDNDTCASNGAIALRRYAELCPYVGDAGAQPLFVVPNEVAITGELLDKLLKLMLARTLGSDSVMYSMHSMRIGAATALLAADYSHAEICRALRWVSLPSELLYARPSAESQTAITTTLRGGKRPLLITMEDSAA